MENIRIEKDGMGELEVPSEAYYGIHTQRALENFNVSNKTVNLNLIYGITTVKKAAAMANYRTKVISKEVADSIVEACDEITEGQLDSAFVVNALQGGAGTSSNMNVNEVVANRAEELLGGNKGEYKLVHPLHHVNCSQSTNDVYPTALRIAAINLLRPLHEAIADLQTTLQMKEDEFAHILRLGRTQLMDALPMTVGQGFGAYSKAVARDRWRLYKVEERLRHINIGGTAIGTGLNASLKYTYLITDILQDITGLGLARSEFSMDVTQNMDVFVEVSGLLKAAAANLLKISNDLRLLASGPRGGFGEISLEKRQAGSSIMPGKVNPVMCEMMGQVAMKVIANDTLITQAACNGQLELNAFGPIIAESLLESLAILKDGVRLFNEKCVRTIEVNARQCEENVLKASALATALVRYIGYEQAGEVARIAYEENKSIKEVALEKQLFEEEELDNILNIYQVTKPGIPGK